MRRFHAFLLLAGLVAAPAGAVAEPSDCGCGSLSSFGVTVMTLSPELRTHFGSTDKSGVLVSRVEPGSPAAMAGIAVGDLLMDIHGTKLDDAGDLLMASSKAMSDKPLRVKALRGHKPQTFEVTPARTTTSAIDKVIPLSWIRDFFGIKGSDQS